MVVKEALLRRVSSLLSPWLRPDPEAALKFELGFFKCEGVLGASELNVSALNEAFLQSSSLLIKSATVGSVHITFMPWRNPVLTLEINGLHIVMSPRPPDDGFWRKTNQPRTAEQEQKAALLHIDPLGSALHAAAEKVTGLRPSRDLIVTLLTNMILQGAKIKLIDISVELLWAVKAPREIPAESATVNNLNGCCLSVNSFTVEDGYYRQSHSPGGFLSAAMISVFFSCRGAEGSKICDIKDLGLELKKPEIIQLHSVEVHDKYIIFLQKLTVSVQLSNLQLSNLEFFIPEAKLGLCPRDLNELMIILKHLNLIAVDTMESVKYTQLIAEGRHGISGKDLWKRALEHVRRPTPRRRMEKLVETVILQRQYFQAYVSWLREVGWVPKEFQIGFRSNQVKNKRISSCIEGLWKEVCKMEKDLPVEAIALARRVARHKVFAQLQLENLEGESNNFRRKKIHLHLPLLQRFFSLPLRCLRKLIGGFNAFIVYLYNTLRNLVYYACSFLKKGFHCQSAGERSATMTQTLPFCSTKHNKKPCNFTGLYYRVDLCEVFITIRCNDINKMTVPGQIEGVSFSSIAGSSVELKLENLSLLYATNERNAVEFSLVCGELKGHIFSTSSNNEREGSGSRQIFSSSSNNKLEDSGSKSANQDSYSRQRAGMDSSGRNSISSMCNAVLEKHQREMWSDWENKFVKYNISAGPTQSTATRKPFLLCEAKSFSVDPSLRNPNSGVLKCGLSVDELLFDLDCSFIMYIVLLYLQLLDAFSWTSLNGSKKPSNSLDWSVTNSYCMDKRWEEFHELYTERVRHAMLRVIPEKSIHLTAVIAGPKIQLSSSLTEYLKFQKQTTFSENDASFVFRIDFGNLEVAIWPADHIEALTFAEEHNRYNRFEPGHGWLKKLPQSDLSVRSDSYTGQEQFGLNAYLKLENAVVLLENRSELPLVKPFTITVQSSVCRDQCTSLTSMEKALMAAVSCTVSAVTVMCPVDELSFVFQVLEDRLKLLDIFLKFLVTARDVCSSRELHAESDILCGNREYLGCISGKLVPHKFGMGNSPLLTSFAVVMTFDLESLDLPFEVSRRNLDGHRFREKGSGFRNGKQYKIRKEKQRVGNSWRWFDFPITDMRVSFQNCVVEFSWGDKKQAQLFLKFSGIQAVVRDGAFEPCRNLRGQDMKAETSPVEATETHPEVLTQLIVRTSTFNVVGGPYVSEQMLLEKNVRTDIGSSSTSQIRYTSQSAECVLPFQTYKTQLNEPERNRCLDRYPTSSCWLRVDIDLSECFLTDSSLEVLISEATLKLSGSKRMRALFEVGKGFQTVSGGAKGGFLVLQTGALATLMESYRAYQILLKGFASRVLSLPFVSSRQGSEPTSGVHGVHKKRPFIGTLSFKVQQFSSVLAHVDMSGGEQGFLVEMDLGTMFALENEKEELSFDLSRLMILGIHPNQKVIKGKQQAGQIPHFGSTSFALHSNDAKKSVNLQLPSSATNLTGINESYTSSDQVVWDTHSRRDATSSSYVSTSRDCHILECMTAQFSIERSLAEVNPRSWKWRGGWNGQCSISGIALTFTTSEILMLLSLTSPISEPSSGDKASNLPTMGTCEYMPNDENELECKIPDGTIVAIKDVQEHLYLAVKNVEGKHQLFGVPHHTLVGAGAALFRVKHQAQRSWGKFQSWFSLLSLIAKNEDGEPYRVHCHPGSSLVDISSTNDKSCELWHAIPFKYKAEDDIEEHDIYGHLCKKWLHFINKKSGSSLAFVNARLQLVKKPGNPLKLKIFSPATLRKTLPFDTLPTNVSDKDGSLKLDPLEETLITTSVPRVKVTVNMFVITILYESSGAIHFFPLLRVYLDSAESVVQVSSHKFRIISTFKIGLESYEAQTDNWMEMLQKVEICFVYRARLVSIEEKDFVFKKPLISFYSILKQVDLFVREPSLDICLFLVGELNLGGPYTIRNSPVTANCCKVLNNTGLDLLCHFDDSIEAKIAAWQSESFLTRHMVSRKDPHPKSSMQMSWQLVKSGMVSSTPVQISLEQLGVTTLRTRLESRQSKKSGPGPLVVVDVSKENEDGLSVTVSPMVRIHNKSGCLLELRCRRPKQREDGGATVCLKHGDIIDDSMGAFDAFDMSGESKKALLSFVLGNYLLCVRPVNDEASFADGEISPSFEWSEDLKGVKAVRISGLFDKLSYHMKQTFYGQNAESGFSMIHCGLNSVGTKPKDLYFLVRTTKRKVGTLYTPDHPKPQSQIFAWQQQDILILPTIQVSNLLEMKIAVTSSDHLETNSGEISEQCGGNHAILEGGQKKYMYSDLSKLFLTVTLYDLKQTSSPINAGDWGKFSNKSKGELHDLDIELDFGDGKHIAMLRLSRGDMGHLEVIIFTRYALQNDTGMPLICWASQQESFFMWKRNDKQTRESGNIIPLNPMSRISWFEKHDKILIRRVGEKAIASLLDLENFSGFMEISLVVQEETSFKDIVKMGINSQLSSSKRLEPTHTICLVPRYIALNQSSENILVCQCDMQETANAVTALNPGQEAILHMKILAGEEKVVCPRDNIFNMRRVSGMDSSLFVQFSLKEPGWSWSGPICSASLGRFFLKMRSCSNSHDNSQLESSQEKRKPRFAVVDVKEEGSKLIMHFQMQSPEILPYRIVNGLRKASIQFHQKELTETDTLEPGATVGYVWDNLNLPHMLFVQVAGTQLQREISLDKLESCKHFYKNRQSGGVGLSLLSGDHLEDIARYRGNDDRLTDEVDFSKVVYEVYADGPTRVLWVYEAHESHKKRDRLSQNQIPYTKIDCKVSHLGISLLERGKQQLEVPNVNNCYTPIIFVKFRSIALEFIITRKHTLCSFNVEKFVVEEKWHGAPFTAMLRVRGQDYFQRDEHVLHMFLIVSNNTSNPNQVKYSSVVLQALDLHLDEDTLMKLVPFYRSSLADSITPHRAIYFEHFEIHPIKIVASFLPGHPRANYTSAQETLRAFLHSIIKIPAVKGTVVELNGLLLSHALMTFHQLAIKCAQHYSWYMMRAIYIAKGSQLLPPSFVSLFDDSASTSFDFFIDPSDHLQTFTKGMFNLVRKGIGNKEFSGTNRYLGDLGHTIKTAGSNVLFEAVREVSDNVMKGAETSGFNGMVHGFYRGILKLAMEPSVLGTAAVKGGYTYQIKLEHSADMDELYIEGYLQAMLDALFKQSYLRVKVVDDQVLLKNLPPNSVLMNEIKQCVKNFLIGEGLLAGESSQAVNSLRRLHGESEWQVVPRLKAVCEQLFVIFAIRALRRQTDKILHMSDSNKKSTAEESSHDGREVALPGASKSNKGEEKIEQGIQMPRHALGSFLISTAVAYVDGRLCRHIPNALVRRIVSGFLLSFVE